MGATTWTVEGTVRSSSIWEPGTTAAPPPAPAPVLGWVSATHPGILSTGTPVHANEGNREYFGYPEQFYFGIVGGATNGEYSWTSNWTSSFGDTAPVITDVGNGIAYVTFNERIFSDWTSRGTLVIGAINNGTASTSAGNIDIAAGIAGLYSESTVAWGPV
jgi:hypothetical protein